MATIEEVIAFVKECTSVKDIKPDDDIFKVTRLFGDDCDFFIEQYAKQFNVDCSCILWYFHYEEEGFLAPGRLFYKSPDQRVDRIPLTPLMLTDFANKGFWGIDYPPHKAPKKRYDIIVNRIAAGAIILAVVAMVIYNAISGS